MKKTVTVNYLSWVKELKELVESRLKSYTRFVKDSKELFVKTNVKFVVDNASNISEWVVLKFWEIARLAYFDLLERKTVEEAFKEKLSQEKFWVEEVLELVLYLIVDEIWLLEFNWEWEEKRISYHWSLNWSMISILDNWELFAFVNKSEVSYWENIWTWIFDWLRLNDLILNYK